MHAGGRVKTRADVRCPRDIHKRQSELAMWAGQVSRIGAATETFRCIYSNALEDARLDRSRLADDLCDALIRLVRSSLVFTFIVGFTLFAAGSCRGLLRTSASACKVAAWKQTDLGGCHVHRFAWRALG